MLYPTSDPDSSEAAAADAETARQQAVEDAEKANQEAERATADAQRVKADAQAAQTAAELATAAAVAAQTVFFLQTERQNKFLLSTLREYSNLFCLTSKILKKAKKDVLIFHPGPVNRGIEISLEVMESNRSFILNQVTNGVAVRMALMYLLLGGNNESIN